MQCTQEHVAFSARVSCLRSLKVWNRRSIFSCAQASRACTEKLSRIWVYSQSCIKFTQDACPGISCARDSPSPGDRAVQQRREAPSASGQRSRSLSGQAGGSSQAPELHGHLKRPKAAAGGLSPKPTPDSHIRAQNHDGGALPRSPAAERTTAEKAKRRPNGNASHESVWHQPSRKEELTIVRNATRARGIFVGAKRRAACSHANCFAD